MTRTVVALFEDFNTANGALRELVDNGFSRDDISLVASDMDGEYGRYVETGRQEDVDTSSAAQGAGVGAGIGAALGGLGGLLIGLGALTIPGIGPVLAAGPLAAALTGLAGAGAGAVAGGVTGGLIGALVDMGVPEETAQYYAEGVRRGGHLITVRTADHMTDRAVEILNRHNPMDINERASQWRQEGWVGFDPNSEPYRTTRERDRGGEFEGTHRTEMDDPAYRTGTEENLRRTGMDAGLGAADMNRDYQTTDYSDFSAYDDRFRNHFQSSYTTDNTYEQYQPAYRYGYDLATDERYVDRDWNDIEMEAYQRWDERNPGTWEQFKAAVRHAYEEIRDSLR
jgi:hypothetical protein